MAINSVLPKEKEFTVECEAEADVIPSRERQSDAEDDKIILSNKKSLFFRLWQQYEKDLYRNCLKFMNNQQDAEDLLANVMLQAWHAWKQGDEISHFKGWLFRISSNLSVNMQRKNQRRNRDLVSLDRMIETGQELPKGLPSAEQLFLSEKIPHIISQSIATLHPRLRECARQHFLLEMEYQEIACELAISVDNVRKRIHEARPVLREAMRAYLSSTPGKTSQLEALHGQRELNAPVVNMFVVVPVSLSSGVVHTFHLGMENKPTRLQQKLKRLQAYVEQYPNGWKKRLALAEVLYLMGRWEEAIDAYQQVLAKRLGLLEVSLRVGHMLHLLERKEEAIEVYQNAFWQAYQPASKYHLHGLIARLSQQDKAAVTSFEAAIALEPQNPLHWHQLGQLHLERKAFDAALHAFDAALALNPNDLVALSDSYQPLVALGDHQEAERRLNRILELTPKDVRTLARLANRRLQMGLVHGQEGKQSKRLILAAQREAPYTPEVSALLASYYFCKGKIKKGIAVLHAFVSKYPTHPGGLLHYIRVLSESGQQEAAQEVRAQHASLMASLSDQVFKAACDILPTAGSTTTALRPQPLSEPSYLT